MSKHGTEEQPFVEVHLRTPNRDDALVQLVGRLWQIHLARLYMYTGRCIPREAKKNGCFFGFCDARGIRVADVKVDPDGERPFFKVESPATHVGWTVAASEKEC